jgi:hypothetical protein
MYNFITLFDKNYLSRGLALYNSLVDHCNNFFLYILALDQETKDFLSKENLKNISIVSLNQIESFYPELKDLKKARSTAEYCWTLTPYSIQYTIKYFNLNSCTYLDSDIYFFNNPKILFDEARNNSIIITEHRYTHEYDQTKTSGKYCVQFVFFKNDNDGMEALEWWRQRCKEWCYSKFEDGKFGDQKYLDDWTTRFKNVYVPTHIGCGLAPWNIRQYDINITDDKLYVCDKITKRKEPIIFFHFHGIKIIYRDFKKINWYLGGDGYFIDENTKEKIYTKYIKLLSKDNVPINNSLIRIKKPDFITILYMVIKNIIRSLFIFKMYKHYKNILMDEYNNKRRNILTVYLMSFHIV